MKPKRKRTDLITHGLIGLMALLVWWRAADGTQSSRIVPVRVVIDSSDPGIAVPARTQGWFSVDLTLRGTERTLARIATRVENEGVRIPINVDNAAANEFQPMVINTLEECRAASIFEDSGVSIEEVTPTSLTIELDRVITKLIDVSDRIGTIQVEGDTIVQPSKVNLTMRKSDFDAWPQPHMLELVLPTDAVEFLTPGEPKTLKDVEVLPRGLTRDEVRNEILPTTDVTITMKEIRREFEVSKPVRINLIMPPQQDQFIELSPTRLTDVTIYCSPDLQEKIRRDEAVVIAQLQLRGRDIEARMDRKRIAGFAVIDAAGIVTTVDGHVGDQPDLLDNQRPMVEVAFGNEDESPVAPGVSRPGDSPSNESSD